MTGALNMGGFVISNVASPSVNTDAVSKTYADARYLLAATTLDAITAPTADVSLNSHKITNLANATADGDALNRQTADSRYLSSSTRLD